MCVCLSLSLSLLGGRGWVGVKFHHLVPNGKGATTTFPKLPYQEEKIKVELAILYIVESESNSTFVSDL